MIGITFGVWDLLHYGHINFLRQARGKLHTLDTLCVGVCGDDLNKTIKGKLPIFNQGDRCNYLYELGSVDLAFIYTKSDYKHYYDILNANLLIVGEEFGRQGVPEHEIILKEAKQVIVIPRTPEISSTMIRKCLKN